MDHSPGISDKPLDESDPAFFERVRLTAYFLWEQDGRPEGRAEEYWRRAHERHRAGRTFDTWLGEEPTPRSES